MYDDLDSRQIKRLKELVPYRILAPDADEVIEELERLNNIINKAIEWCDAVINSEFTYDKLPNGEYTDMGYCLALAEPLLKILKGDEEDI